MRKIIIAAVFALIASPIAAEPLVLHLDRNYTPIPAQRLASNVQTRRGFHIPPLPPPLHFPGTDPTPVPAPVPNTDLASSLAALALPDLQNALAIANAQTPPDITAATCWSGLIPIVQSIQSQLPAPGTTPMGAATALQIARDLINAPTSPIIKQVNVACAPLYMDTKVGLVNFAAQFAGIFAGAAILSPIKPLPIP